MTLADAAGCDCVYLAATRGRSGHSYLPLLSEASANVAGQRRDAQFREYGNTRMIRTNLYKLIELYRGPNGHFPVELYNWPRKRKQTHVMAIKRSYSISEARSTPYFSAHSLSAHGSIIVLGNLFPPTSCRTIGSVAFANSQSGCTS